MKRCLSFSRLVLDRHSNQARGLAEYSLTFLQTARPSESVLERLKLFHLDSLLCAVSALADKARISTLLRREALAYALEGGVQCIGSHTRVHPEKAVLANCAAIREWDMNGNMFGYHPHNPAQRAGEFGQNDFYPVATAAAQMMQLSGQQLTLGMLLADEIRGRLGQAFSLRRQGVDHTLFGGVASVCVFGALSGASERQIEKAIGMLASHYIPSISIRKGFLLSDSKEAASALVAEAAVQCVSRSMNGFEGPEDIFRQPWSVFSCGETVSAFDLELGLEGEDFAVQTMHFKLGRYAHLTSSAQLALLKILQQVRGQLTDVHSIKVTVFSLLNDFLCQPSKRRPKNRSTADHSLYFILARLIRKSLAMQKELDYSSIEALWSDLMLMPEDYSSEALNDPLTLQLIDKISIEHGGADYDSLFPKGQPSRVRVECAQGCFDSELVLTPPGYSSCTEYRTRDILDVKCQRMGKGLEDYEDFVAKLKRVDQLTREEVQHIYTCKIKDK